MIKIIDINESIIDYTFNSMNMENERDFSNNIIIFPTKRLVNFFYNKLSNSVKASFIPPKIFSIDDFVKEYSLLIDFNKRFINRFKAIEIIFNVINNNNKGDFYLKNSDDFIEFYKWGNKLFSVFEEIIIESDNIENIDFNIYEEFVRLGDYHKNYKEFIQVLPRLVKDYISVLNERAFLTRALSYRFLERNREKLKRLINDKKIIISGFGLLNIKENSIFKSILENKKSLMIFKAQRDKSGKFSYPFEVIKKSIDNLGEGFDYEGNELDYWSHIVEKVVLNKCTDVEDEMNSLFLKLKSIKEINPLRVGIVLSNPENLFPFIQSVISRFKENELSFNITIGYPFKRIPLFGLIESIFEVFKTKEQKGGEEVKYYSIAFINLIRHPYIKTIKREDFFKTIHLIEKVLVDKNLIYFEKSELMELINNLGSIEIEDDLKGVIKEDLDFLFENFVLNDFESIDDFKEFFLNLIKTIEKDDSKGFLFLNHYLMTFNNIINEFFNDFNSGLLKTSLIYNKKKFFRLFIDYISYEIINLLGSPLKGVQVMGLLEFRGLDFDKVFILDVNEGITPGVNRFDPILPYDIRRFFKIDTYKERESIYAYNFYSIINNSKSAELFWIDDESEIERSRYIERLVYESEKRGKNISINVNEYDFKIDNPKIEDIKKNEEIRNMIIEKSFSPTSLELYLKCPAKFYYHEILGLKKREKIEEDAEANKIGSLVHKVLQSVYENIEKYKNENDYNYLDKLIEKGFKELNLPLKGLNLLKLEFAKQRIKEFLDYDFKRIDEKAIEIKELEKRIGYVYKFKRNEKEYSLKLKGFIDRIEREGEIIRLIDYKTGKYKNVESKINPDEFAIRELIEIDNTEEYLNVLKFILDKFKGFQILLYLMIYNEFKNDYSNFDGSYIFLKEGMDIESVFNSKYDKNKLMAIFKELIKNIYVDILERDKFIRTDKKSICQNCDYKDICKKFGDK